VRHITPQLCAQLSCISLFLILSSPAAAQLQPTPRIRPGMTTPEWSLTSLRKNLPPAISVEHETRILWMTLRDDFRQLQIINNDLMKRTFIQSRNNPGSIGHGLGITSKEIRSSLGEIRKRAGRLKTNLRLPEVTTQKDETGEDWLRGRTMSSGLLMLDQTVTKFVENPYFQQPRVLDAQHSLRAAKDLNKILRLTDSLRKLAKQDPAQLAKQDPKK
jgi:hypothetical protein